MKTVRRRASSPAFLACIAALLACLCIAAPAAPAASTSTAPVPTPATPAPPTTTPTPPPPAPAAPRLLLSLQRVGGKPTFALMGGRIVVRGVLWPYVGGQAVKVSVYREGRKVAVIRVPIAAVGNGAGQFHISYVSRSPGLVQARVAHYATPQQAAFSGRSPVVRFVQANLGPGARGQSVRLLQSELNVLHYAVPLSGVFDEGTGRALVAYRKMTGMARVPYAGRRVFQLLGHGAGQFRVHYRGDGRHVEADLTRQVLAEIGPGGRVQTIYTMSSGKPSTPTVVGRFRVYEKAPGTNAKGMVDSNYFIRGYAIHGYPEVPTYAASHGCLRVPIPNAASIFSWVRQGTPVDVYNESGGGSKRVRHNAGP
jgi:peptidoglycan hydrolase-like protein with peptidoglycan-binding domain